MKRLLLIGIATLTMLGCGNDKPDCGRISDSYNARETRLSGDCPTSAGDDGPYTIQIFDNHDGTVELVFDGLNGSCTGVLEACDVVAPCVIGSQSDPSATANLDFTLTPDGLEGEVSLVIAPGVRSDAPDGCTVRYRTTATR